MKNKKVLIISLIVIIFIFVILTIITPFYFSDFLKYRKGMIIKINVEKNNNLNIKETTKII